MVSNTRPTYKLINASLLTSSCLAAPISKGVLSSLAAFSCTLLTIPLALTPNLRDESVSAALSIEGEQQMMRAVFAVPPKESCKAVNVHQHMTVSKKG